MLSDRGIAMVLFGIGLLFAGAVYNSTSLLLLGGISLVVVVVSMPLLEFSAAPAHFQIKRELDRPSVFVGDYLAVTVTVFNKSRFSVGHVKIVDKFPEVFTLVMGDNIYEGAIPAGKMVTYTYILRCELRGKYEIGPTSVLIYDRAGFNFATLSIHETTEIKVLPGAEDLKKMDVMAKYILSGMSFGAHKTKQSGLGSDFYGIRRYVTSDEYKHIDWKATARVAKLMVRQFEAEKNVNTIIMLDMSSGMAAGPLKRSKIEYAIRATVVLAKMSMKHRDNIGLLLYTNKVEEYLPPASNEMHFNRILDVLATAMPKDGSDLKNAMNYLVKRLRRSSFIIIISDLEEREDRILDAIKLALARKHTVLIISPFGPWFEMPENASVIERAIGEAIGEELMTRRKKFATKLKRFGIDIINVGPHDFIPTVLAQYLKTKKSRGEMLR